MKSSQKKNRRQSESQFYEPTKEALNHFLTAKDCPSEVTAARPPSEDIKQVLTDYNLFANIVERFIPDLTGYIEEGRTESLTVVKTKSLIVVEVKPGPPRLKDIFQTKEYAEIFGAKHAFLISPHPPQEEIKRILGKKSEILSHTANSGRVFIGHLSEHHQTMEEFLQRKPDTGPKWLIESWYPQTPTI